MDDEVFAFVLTEFKRAYPGVGRAVMREWARIRLLEEPKLAKDAARVTVVATTAANIRAVAIAEKEKGQRAISKNPNRSALGSY